MAAWVCSYCTETLQLLECVTLLCHFPNDFWKLKPSVSWQFNDRFVSVALSPISNTDSMGPAGVPH